jgi:hypothetical protein
MNDVTLAATPAVDQGRAEPEGKARRLRILAALGLSFAVDVIQLPATVAWLSGGGGPIEWALNEGLDLVTMGVLTRLVGFHWSFLPAFLVESLPMVDVAPTWTGSVLLATRKELRALLSGARPS